jgi:hypothetical protein
MAGSRSWTACCANMWPAIRDHKHIQSSDTAPVNFTPFESAYQALTDKLRPQVFSLEFFADVARDFASKVQISIS